MSAKAKAFRVTPEEEIYLREICEYNGITFSDLVRLSIRITTKMIENHGIVKVKEMSENQ